MTPLAVNQTYSLRRTLAVCLAAASGLALGLCMFGPLLSASLRSLCIFGPLLSAFLRSFALQPPDRLLRDLLVSPQHALPRAAGGLLVLQRRSHPLRALRV